MRHLRYMGLYDTKAFKGGNNQLLVAVEPFEPQVTCQGVLESDKEACGEIISHVPKNYQPHTFGRLGDRTADFILPYVLISRKNNWIPTYE